MADEEPPDTFTDLLKKIARVPKREIDEREREYRRQRDAAVPARPKHIVPTLPDKG